jgi:hypothetical protein
MNDTETSRKQEKCRRVRIELQCSGVNQLRSVKRNKNNSVVVRPEISKMSRAMPNQNSVGTKMVGL